VCGRQEAGYVAQVMDEYEHIDVDGLEFAPVERTTQSLALLSLEEAHDLLGILVTVAAEGEPMSAGADRLAREIAARIPSEN
jgi:hypothetical protein